MKRIVIIIMVSVLSSLLVKALVEESGEDTTTVVPALDVQNYVYKADRNTTPSVDHSLFEVLQEDFETAHDATAACLSCHNKRHNEIMSTAHWQWERREEIEGKGVVP